ncbi:MAG: HAD family hydrolase [Magnetococcales bacterium]|nr:HAD family hydrolase [Magnetococcales bacterium]
MSKRALFLDRDGVINVDYGYVHRIEAFVWIEGIFELTRQACRLGYAVVVVTNQAGIGRGFYSEAQFHQLTDWMRQQFAEAEAPIDRVLFSPFHPTEGVGPYRREDPSRKPGPGMILQAARELNLDLAASLLIGDRSTDIQAGIAAGVGTSLLFAPKGVKEPLDPPCPVIASLRDALPYLTPPAC